MKPILHIRVGGYTSPDRCKWLQDTFQSRFENDYEVIITSNDIEIEFITEEAQKAKLLRATLNEVDLKSIYDNSI